MIGPDSYDKLTSWAKREMADARDSGNIRRGQGNSRGYNYWKGRADAFEAFLQMLDRHLDEVEDAR